MKRAGNISDMAAREMVTVPSSSGLAQNFENVAGELGKFVEKEQAVVRERDFAGARGLRRRDQAGVRDGVMRRTIGALADEPLPGSRTPATLWIFVVSSASSKVSGGRMVGMRLASMVLPEPGGPIINMLWPPAQAISMARLAVLLARERL